MIVITNMSLPHFFKVTDMSLFIILQVSLNLSTIITSLELLSENKAEL